MQQSSTEEMDLRRNYSASIVNRLEGMRRSKLMTGDIINRAIETK